MTATTNARLEVLSAMLRAIALQLPLESATAVRRELALVAEAFVPVTPAADAAAAAEVAGLLEALRR